MYDLMFNDAALTSWALLRQTWSLLDRVAETRLARVGLTPEKVAVLWTCREHPGPLIPAEIARFLSRESQSVTGLINRMEQDGLVTRIPKRKGRPFTEIKLTSKGQEYCSKGVAVMKSVVQEAMSSLADGDYESLQKLLRALRQQAVENLDVDFGPPPRLKEAQAIPVKW